MGTRAQNERRFGNWVELPNGGRRYYVQVPGRDYGNAAYLKEVDSNEVTIRFWQEIFDDAGKLIELHEKFPNDMGHRKI